MNRDALIAAIEQACHQCKGLRYVLADDPYHGWLTRQICPECKGTGIAALRARAGARG